VENLEFQANPKCVAAMQEPYLASTSSGMKISEWRDGTGTGGGTRIGKLTRTARNGRITKPTPMQIIVFLGGGAKIQQKTEIYRQMNLLLQSNQLANCDVGSNREPLLQRERERGPLLGGGVKRFTQLTENWICCS
jgi:hypothetical protein